MKYLLYSVLFFTLLYSCTIKDEFSDNLALANSFFDSGKYDSAIVVYSKLLTVAPNNENILFFRASSYFNIEDFEKSIFEFKKVIALNMKNNFARNSIGVAYFNLGKIDSALVYFYQCLEVDSLDSEAYNNIGFMNANSDNYKEAISNYNKAISLYPDFLAARFNKANLLKKLKKFTPAILEMDTILSINKSNSNNFILRGELYLQVNKIDSACYDFKKALNLGDSSAISKIKEYCN